MNGDRPLRLGGAAPVLCREWAARLPFWVELGPYRLSVQLRDSSKMLDGRRLACVNIEEQRFELRPHLSGMKLAEAFVPA